MFKIRNQSHFRFRGVLIVPILILTALSSTTAFAQRNTYRNLSFRYNRPNIYVTTFTLPGETINKVQLTAAFKLNYTLFAFKKLDNLQKEAKFYSTASLNLEIYKSPEKNLRFNEQVSIVDLESVASVNWSDTVYAVSYEETQSTGKFAVGYMQIQLPPGHYTYLLQLGINGSANKRTSPTRNIHINSYENSKPGEIILAGDVDMSTGTGRINLINMGNNVSYRNDFYAFVPLPGYTSDKSYQLQVHRVNISREDTAQTKLMVEEAVPKSAIKTAISPKLISSDDQLLLTLQKQNNGYTYALLQIPNHSFPDETYSIKVIEKQSGQTIAQKIYRSVWVDKPLSLYNIDVAISMLRYITDEQTIEQIESGSTAEEKEKFARFWKKKDPTPNTPFNELKVEYYQRIDYAYEHFSSQETPGFESDRGRIYILYGPPNNIDRVYPTEGPTREIWTYDKRQFVFKATSGFGDFVLISN